ncbi:MAG: hypothetical protein CMP07_00225 [Xanthomonadales bacterium]|nr:hypothetical protein [Xanthomonadales bacterium]
MMRVEIFVAFLLLIGGPANAQTTTFTYQGYLTEAGTAADGTFDFELALYNVEAGGTSIDVNAFDDVTVTGGLFELAADFTGAPFEAGGGYWVEARVRDGASTGAFTPLLPRQPVNASPYAIAAQAVIAPLDVDGEANVQGALSVDGDITTAGEVRAGRVEADEVFSDGPVDLQGGVAIQRFNDSVALLVENSGPTQPAVRVVGELEVDGEFSCAAASGCVELAALQPGSYRSRDELYESSSPEISIPPGLIGAATASCTDSNDRPLNGACPQTSSRLVGTDVLDWTDPGSVAGYQCRWINLTSTTIVASAKIVCISIP